MAEKNTNKILTIVLAVIICIAAIVILYVSLPKNETTDDTNDNNTNGTTDNNETEEPATVLTIIYGEEQIHYTMDEIKVMNPYSGEGAKISSSGKITGPYNYTGVKISTFLAEFEDLPTNYSLIAKSIDDYNQSYKYDEVQGTVEKLNETGVSLGNASFTMIIAYMQEEEEITEDGPLMIVFVDDYYTASGKWVKQLSTIEIVEE